MRFDQSKNQTPDQLNQISLNGRDKVRESFQKYLDDQNNGMPIKTKILRQMAENGEITEEESPEVVVALEETNEEVKEAPEVVLQHPDAIEEVPEDSSASDKISEVVIIGMFLNLSSSCTCDEIELSSAMKNIKRCNEMWHKCCQ